ncbi:MAG: sugar ABC transporter permease [Chloroflexi bacterium]|nr:sugar ABC transporter permease [Chloroflexota bacterium]
MAVSADTASLDRAETAAVAPSRHVRSERRLATMLLLPSVLFLVLMTIFPTIYSLWMSMQQYNLSRPDLAHFVGLRNFGQLLVDDLFWKSVRVTFVFSLSVLALQFIIGFFVANLFDRERRGMNLLRTLFIIPVFASPVALGLTWRYMYQPGYGLINYFLESVGLPRINWLASPQWALPAVIAVDVWQWTPFVALILLAGMQSISPEITEAAELDGLSRFQYLWRIVLPLLTPIIVVVGLIRLIDALKTFDLIYIITRGGPGTATYNLPLHAYSMGFASFLMGTSAAIAWVVVIIVNVCAVTFLWLLSREQ